jgi:hypothetical protein
MHRPQCSHSVIRQLEAIDIQTYIYIPASACELQRAIAFLCILRNGVNVHEHEHLALLSERVLKQKGQLGVSVRDVLTAIGQSGYDISER